jgi:SAM-dependent methyltransferase
MTDAGLCRTIATMPLIRHHRQAEALRTWLATSLGRGLLEEAQRNWAGEPSDVGGQVMLQFVPLEDWAIPEAHARFATVGRFHPREGRWQGPWRGEEGLMPLSTGSVSRIELRFVLESVQDPARLLAECARLLCPGGRLLVMGINPYGLARLRWASTGVAAVSRRWVVQEVTANGLESLASQVLGPRWSPPSATTLGAPKSRVPFGRVAWAVLAIRRDIGLTPLRPARQRWSITPGVPAA